MEGREELYVKITKSHRRHTSTLDYQARKSRYLQNSVGDNGLHNLRMGRQKEGQEKTEGRMAYFWERAK